MLTRTPPASRFVQSQPWGASAAAAVSFFTTSATTHERKPPLRPIPSSTGWDDLPAVIPRRNGSGTGQSTDGGEIKPLQRSGYPTPTPSPRGSADILSPAKANPHARSEIMKEMKAFIWEKISAEAKAASPRNTSDEAQEVQYKLARDPTLPASPNIFAPKHPTKLKLPPGMPSEIHRWLNTAHTLQQNKAEVYNGPTLLLLTAAPKNLLESDFYRLARQGAHLENWAVGLVRVVQGREQGTYEPAGRYYVFFETRAAAMAYEEEMHRLHSLARRRLAHSPDRKKKDPLAMSQQEKDEEERLKGFTLVPASAKLEVKLWLGKDVELGGGKEWEEVERNIRKLFRAGGEEMKTVLVSLEGAMSTVSALHDAIERDAAERMVPWRPEGLAAIRAVEAGGEAVLVEEGDGLSAEGSGKTQDEEAAVKRKQRFSRFVVPFADENGARRFVRHWHKREFPDFEGRDMTLTVNATAMW